MKKVCSVSRIVNLPSQKVINIGRLPFNFFDCFIENFVNFSTITVFQLNFFFFLILGLYSFVKALGNYVFHAFYF